MMVPRITKEALAQLLEAPASAAAPPPVVVDVRLKYPYEHSTILLPGAQRFPGLPDPAALPRDRPIVFYDSDPEEIVAERLALPLVRAGFSVSVLEGGIAAWAAAKLPTSPKSAPQLAVPVGGPSRTVT